MERAVPLYIFWSKKVGYSYFKIFTGSKSSKDACSKFPEETILFDCSKRLSRHFLRKILKCAYLLDNNIRKWICRLYLGDRKKILLLPDGKKGVKVTLESVNDLHKYKGQLCDIAKKYMQGRMAEDTKEQFEEQ